MKSVIYLFIAAILTLSGAHARGPAVEDFVGIDIEEQDLTPAGTHALFNFEQELNQAGTQARTQALIVKTELRAAAPQTETSPWSQWFGILVILSLPVVTWSLTMKHLNKKVDVELPDNVTVLPIKAKNKSSTDSDDIKKAS